MYCVCVLLHRTLYEGGEQESFLDSLLTRIKGHEKDIERMCNKNYQGFIESVSELLKVKSDALKLKVRMLASVLGSLLPLLCNGENMGLRLHGSTDHESRGG